MKLPSYDTLHVTIDRGVASIVLEHPPVNTLNATMMIDLHDLLDKLRDDTSVVVLVFSSANPEFFLAHVDLGIFDSMPQLAGVAAKFPEVNVHQGIGELLRRQPQVSIVKLAGIARAGGNEFVIAADMTFAAAETAKLAQNEALLGIMPGGGGTQYLLEKMGRARTLEAVLGADLVDAATAAQYGWINRALPADELDAFVDDLARKIAALGAHVVAGVKRALPAADLTEGLKREHDEWSALVRHERAQQIMAAAAGVDIQTPENERDIESLLRRIASEI